MNCKVLLVEDDPQFSKVASRMLGLRGYEVRTAPDVPTARRFFGEFGELGERSTGVVLMDIELPDGNGIDLCREIRATSDVPVIFVSGLEKTDALVESAFDAGGDAYMSKPVNFNELAKRIEEVMQGARVAEPEVSPAL